MKEIGKKYFEDLNDTLKEYFSILSEDVPEFLYEYVGTPAMQKQAKISATCGSYYTKLFNIDLWYSSLDHSVAVALIIWHFTREKKQTISGILHDIATPAFKHCVDFMNGDYETQESTEELTTKIIRESKEIMELLNRDGIKLEEVADYHIYPIADNDTPQLSADRLEYTFSNGLGVRTKIWKMEDVKKIYNNIEVQKNEDGIIELGFKDKETAEKFVHTMSKLSVLYMDDEANFTMQFLADVMKEMSNNNLLTKTDLYNLSEEEIIGRIKNCKVGNISKCFATWRNATELLKSDEPIEDKYCVKIKNKKRYINPLVNENNEFMRIKDISEDAKKDIEKCINFETTRYSYLGFKL